MQSASQHSAFSIQGRYANALFQLACDKKQLNDVAKHIENIKNMIAKSPEFNYVLADHSLRQDIKTGAIMKIMEEANIGTLTKNFIKTILKKNRGDKLSVMIEAFQFMYDAHNAIVPIDISTVSHISETQKQKLTQICQKYLGQKTKIKFNIHPNMIGGIKLSLPDYILDASLSKKFFQLESSFKQHFQTSSN